MEGVSDLHVSFLAWGDYLGTPSLTRLFTISESRHLTGATFYLFLWVALFLVDRGRREAKI